MTREEKDKRKKLEEREQETWDFLKTCLNEDIDRIEREDAEYSQLCDGCLKHQISSQSRGIIEFTISP